MDKISLQTGSNRGFLPKGSPFLVILHYPNIDMYLMQACVHKVVAKLKEKDPPTEWTFEQDHR